MSNTPLSGDDFQMQADLPVIRFDFDRLMTEARAMVAKYDGLLITEDQVKDIKKEMAEINAAKLRLDKARKEAVRKVSEPIKAFEAQIKEVCAIFDTAYEALGVQVKEFERKEREEKRHSVLAMIDKSIRLAQAANPDIADKLSVGVEEKWLNKTASLKSVQGEIDAAITGQIQAERESQRLEQRKAERRLLIENAVKNGNRTYGLDLPVSSFMTPYFESLEVAVGSVFDRIAAYFKERAQGRDVGRLAPEVAQNDAASEVTLSIILSYSTAREPEVRMAITQLKSLCSSFAVRKKAPTA